MITITQYWSEEPEGYNRTAKVQRPRASQGQKFPLLLDLHGSGGQGNTKRFGQELKNSVVVLAPDGYNRKWGQGDQDQEFILGLIELVAQTMPEADMDDVTIIGTSMGAMFLNKLLMNVPNPRPFHRAIPMYGQVSTNYYHDGSFWKHTPDDPLGEKPETFIKTNPATPGPPGGYIYFHGSKDGNSHYEGGSSRGKILLGAQVKQPQ